MGENLYFLIREKAREIAADLPCPSFYTDYRSAFQFSEDFFENSTEIKELKDYVHKKLDNNFGHGFFHARKVAVDAGTILIAEKGFGKTDRNLLLVQTCGLFHDIIRRSENHALESSIFTEKKLRDFPYTKKEIDKIVKAIRNHEAFKKNDEKFSECELILSDCLYDADKFRWGPDNFTHTVWDMVLYADVPVKTFMKSYPKGIKSLHRIKSSFRSRTGRKYGPEFIDLGLTIGEKLLAHVEEKYPELF